jgi:60 kDa SS-A/Ro ribonucleoprotein
MAKDIYSQVSNARTRQRKAKVSTPQTKPIPGKQQVPNSTGGFTFALDEFARLDRFLILGSEGGTFYATAKTLTIENAKNAIAAIKKDGPRVVSRVVEISMSGRAPNNDPALFVLALALTHGDAATKTYAGEVIPKIARIGTHIFHLAQYINGMRSWGRPVRRGFHLWYNEKKPLDLAMQMVKYANRDGWTHADVLKLAHVKPSTPTHDALFTNALDRAKEVDIDSDVADFMSAVDALKRTRDPKVAARLIYDHQLPREVVPTELLTTKDVWEALLPHMGMEAMIRNLATMTRVGIIAPLSQGTNDIIAKMENLDAVKKSRLHPIKVLTALLTYKAGVGQRGSNTWTADQRVLAALNDLFYATFQNVVPTGARILLALDVSGSMTSPDIGGIIGLSPRVASAAMAMVTMRTEKQYEVVGFTSSGGRSWNRRPSAHDDVSGLSRLSIHKGQTLEQVCQTVQGLSFGGTDCSLPMEWARVNNVPVDAFVVYTDNETYAGARHPSQALAAYRQKTGINSRLIVNGMTATNFSIADPNDAGMMDVVGFDSAAPSIMADFIRGEF